MAENPRAASRPRPRAITLVVLLALAASSCAYIARVTVDSAGTAANDHSFDPDISGDGRFVAFASDATNLVDGDTNQVSDIFLRDLATRTTTRISVDGAAVQADRLSTEPSISADGSRVAFTSDASTLSGVSGWGERVHVRDVAAQTMTLVSVNETGGADEHGEQPAISADGTHVAFRSAASLIASDTGQVDIYVRDIDNGVSSLVSVGIGGAEADERSEMPAISGDGRYVAFASKASNLVAGDTNGMRDIFLRDTVAETTVRVSVADSGAQSTWHYYNPAISADGRYVAYQTLGHDLGPSDTNGKTDVYLRDTVAGTTTRVSVDSNEVGANDYSQRASVSADGRYVAFHSYADNLVPGDTNDLGPWPSSGLDVFIRDTVEGTTTRVSVDGSGEQANRDSGAPSISDDGAYVAFQSLANNLVEGVVGLNFDLFVKRTVQPTVDIVAPGTALPSDVLTLSITGTGFSADSAVTVPGGGVTVDATRVISETQLEADIAVDGAAAAGPRSVYVYELGAFGIGTGNIARCTACLDIGP